MNTSSHDFVTVDMRGLKVALIARARAQRESVSVLVRRAVALDLGLEGQSALQVPEDAKDSVPEDAIVKLSIRLTTSEADQLIVGARSAGLSR